MVPRFALAALLVASPAFGDVSGLYSADGRNPDGTRYSGDVRMVQEEGQVSVQWQVGKQTYEGRGPINGDVITVDWGDRFPIVYVVMPDGELHGTWADGTALEKLTPR